MAARRNRLAETQPLSVQELTRQIEDLVEANFSRVFVAGEVSNCQRAASGHVYFTLKDESAQIRAVVWRSTAARLKFELKDGLQIAAAGAIDVYPARGSYQLMCDRVIPQGVGELELRFRELQEKLATEGLFDPARKRPLPAFPLTIALVTSPGGAAVRDVLQVLNRRWPIGRVVVVPTPVQGAGSARRIAGAIQRAERIPGVDVIVTGRGGGSLEDLWAFNEEVVARAIFECKVPVICGVGHEIDVSIAELAADRRALTPTEAAELATPSLQEVCAGLAGLRERLGTALRRRSERSRLALESLARRPVLARPLGRLRELSQRLDDASERLHRVMRQSIERRRQQTLRAAASLQALSPLAVLQRGYSLTQTEDGIVVMQAARLQPDDHIVTTFARGTAVSRIESVDPDGGSHGAHVD